MHNSSYSLVPLIIRLLLISRLIIVEGLLPVIHSITLKNEIIIPKEYQNLPLIAKCCSMDQILIRNKDQSPKCVPSNYYSVSSFSPLFCKFNSSGTWSLGEEANRFVALIGYPCRYESFDINTENDTYYLLRNGSIYFPLYEHSMLMPGINYCMDVTPTLNLVTVVCSSIDSKILMAGTQIICYACGLIIAVSFLILTIVAYSITPKLRDVYGKILHHYCGCLALAFIILAITQLGGVHWTSDTCMAIAFVVQFSFVACYFWLNVMCIETWSLIQNHVHHDAYQRIKPNVLFFYYSIWAWGSSGILILVSLIMDLNPTIPTIYIKPNFISENDSCWFKPDSKTMPYFFVPIGFLLLINLIFFILTGITISRYQKDLALRRLIINQESVRQEQMVFYNLKKTFMICIVLFLFMTLTWALELISWWTNIYFFDWLTLDLVNILHGVFIFSLFVLRQPIRGLIWFRIKEFRNFDKKSIISIPITNQYS
ncbi:G-protein coupled receptor Mth2-like isoform X1 [Vespa crabro]|uniref:G-protein coupled receptor Mth2-like isoform X1 n=1 Tax=Vespa crabro TaxID=7445 RepID=UPI001F023022|nr:G-protein coupled receptor Mth2-like isoform X1 [Vespa crabro]XP_046820010.1 G-protein coupled receptor Mth2-like isoform X1 [Vespa crabro]XP_046820011.1 G-protein coupled receptor Mth2-like isoform X1 [Vespa crabro]